jgi:uncharacterized Zn-finger protein
MSETTCNYCGKVLTTMEHLRIHQKTVLYCINIQKNKLIQEQDQKKESNDFSNKTIPEPEEICEYCNKKFYRLEVKKRHMKTCKKKDSYELLKLNNKMQIELEILKTKLKEQQNNIRELEDKIKNYKYMVKYYKDKSIHE